MQPILFHIGLFYTLLCFCSSEEEIPAKMNLLKKAQKVGFTSMEIRLISDIIASYCWSEVKNYELAFEFCDQLDNRLQNLSSDDIPEIANYYRQIADIYYFFKDYANAIVYYEKVVNEKVTEAGQWYQQGALNGLGLCYRKGFNDLDRSDSCFNLILQTKYISVYREESRDIYDGIAEGNIGRNMMSREDYGRAIPLLKSSMEKVLKYKDYSFAAMSAANLAVCYLHEGNMNETKRYIDSAIACYAILPRDGILATVYEVSSKYYAATGNSLLSMAYMDSLLAINRIEQDRISALQMTRVVERKHLSEQQLKDVQLTGYRRTLLIVGVGLLLIAGILIRYYFLYRKKKAAYRELVHKSLEWAQHKSGALQGVASQPSKPFKSLKNSEQEMQYAAPDDVDISIMNSIEQLMSEEKLFIEPALSVEILSKKLNHKRHNIAVAIHNCTKKSFNTYLNEYRIKEAIQLMSKKENLSISIDRIAVASGFNDRITFYRVFKKITGLSPSDFKMNIR